MLILSLKLVPRAYKIHDILLGSNVSISIFQPFSHASLWFWAIKFCPTMKHIRMNYYAYWYWWIDKHWGRCSLRYKRAWLYLKWRFTAKIWSKGKPPYARLPTADDSSLPLCDLKDIVLVPVHLPGIRNVQADLSVILMAPLQTTASWYRELLQMSWEPPVPLFVEGQPRTSIVSVLRHWKYDPATDSHIWLRWFVHSSSAVLCNGNFCLRGIFISYFLLLALASAKRRSLLHQLPSQAPQWITVPGITHLNPSEPERMLCPVRQLRLYIRDTERIRGATTFVYALESSLSRHCKGTHQLSPIQSTLPQPTNSPLRHLAPYCLHNPLLF